MSSRSMIKSAAVALGLMGAAMSTTAYAGDVSMRVLGWYGNQPQSTKLVRPFWDKISKDSSNGLTALFRTTDEIGLKGFESLRTLQSGAFDVQSFQVSFVGGDDPVLMGVDLPGLAMDFDQQRKVVDAYRPVLEKELQTKYKAHLLAAWPYPFQILFCKGDISKMSDLSGKKIRVSGAYSAELVKQLGGAAVTLSGPEVYQALMQSVVDCGVTGSQYGNSNDWYEVTNTQMDVPIGGAGMVLTVARDDFWNKLSDDQKAYLTKQTTALEDSLWKMAREGHEDGIRCNTGATPCNGKSGKMTLVKPTTDDVALIKKTLKDNVLPLWAKDCEAASKGCTQDWNDTIGKAVGIKL